LSVAVYAEQQLPAPTFHHQPRKILMKDPWELIRVKELELQRVKREVEALRITARLMDDDAHPADGSKPDLHQMETS
jgi:hypothetical protein